MACLDDLLSYNIQYIYVHTITPEITAVIEELLKEKGRSIADFMIIQNPCTPPGQVLFTQELLDEESEI